MLPHKRSGPRYARPGRLEIVTTTLNELASVEQANGNLAKDRLPPLPQKLTPHSLRRAFASILYAVGEDPGVVMDEMGHTDPALSLRVYRQSMRRGEDEKQALRTLLEISESRE